MSFQQFQLIGYVLTSHRQRGHLETAPPFTVPCEGREAQFLQHSHQELNPVSSRGSPLHYRWATPAPLRGGGGDERRFCLLLVQWITGYQNRIAIF